MRKQTRPHPFSQLAWTTLLILTAAGTSLPAGADGDAQTRDELAAEVAALAAEHSRDPATAHAYARSLYHSGEFWRAREVLAPTVAAADPSVDALALAAQLAYLVADYTEAERLFTALVDARSGDLGGQVMAKVGLMFVYYQTGRFAAVRDLGFPAGVQLPTAELMGAFDEPPYELVWDKPERVATLPFLATDPLPVVTLEVDGVPIHAIFDTGADTLILDTEIAAAMGIEWISRAMGTFGGGRQSEVGFGKVGSVRLGDVTMERVPIAILPTKRFTEVFEDSRFPIGGILGTAFMRQFLGTLDYREERLVLRERNPDHAAALRRDLAEPVEIPFVLSATHLMMARGSLDGHTGLTFFVDSGLASEAAFAAPVQTLEHVGIPVPALRPATGVGGGGGVWESGTFPIAQLALGPLEQSTLIGEHGSRPASSYRAHGFIEDGLISHRFLRRYASWTLDFDAMSFVFETSEPTP